MSKTISTEEATRRLTDGIMDYSSDTFIGSDGNVTEEEARGVAALIINDRAEELGYSIDGVMLTNWLEQVRGIDE